MDLSAVLSDNEHATSTGLDPFDNEDMPHGTRTPPTPPSRFFAASFDTMDCHRRKAKD